MIKIFGMKIGYLKFDVESIDDKAFDILEKKKKVKQSLHQN